MTQGNPVIVWPAPGSPAILEACPLDVTVIVARESAIPPGDYLRDPALVDFDGSRWPLELLHVREIARECVPEQAAGFAGLASSRHLHFSACVLRLDACSICDGAPSTRLFHLAAGNRRLQPRCVAIRNPASTRLRLAFASDIHFSTQRVELVAAARRHLGQGVPLADPLENWQRFVEDSNARWRRGDLDVIVLGGDLVDHVHRGDDDRGDTNVGRFCAALEPLRVPTFAIAGNHDYRLNPWRPRVYGRRALGLERRDARRVLASEGLWDGGPLRPGDLRALHTRDEEGTTGLAEHLRRLSPATDFHVDVAGTRLVFASSGADALARWRTAGFARLPGLVRSLAWSWRYPDAEGLYDDQVDRIIAALEAAGGAALFVHAPLLHREAGRPARETIERIPARSPGAESRIERRWRAKGLRTGVCTRNVARLLDALLRTSCPAAVFSGHVHRSTRLDIDRDTREIESVEGSMPVNPRKVTLFTAPALGQADPRVADASGYLVADFLQGCLRSASVQKVLYP